MNACVISTFRCNARCHMCNIWKNQTSIEDEITPEIVSKLPDNLGRINLSGGEPMLRDDINDLVKILYKKCRVLEISTNGFYTERLIKIAENYPKVMIRISLEGLPALNDSLRGTKDGFDHAMRSMLELKKTKVKNIGFSVVICDKNVNDLVKLYNLAVNLDVEFAQSTMHNSWFFHKTDNRNKDKDIVLAEMGKFMADLLTSKRRTLKLKIKDWMRAYFNLRIYNYIRTGASQQKICTAGDDLFFLDPLGNIAPCNGSDQEWIMGNLKEKSFAEIWNSQQAEKIRNMVKVCPKECAFIGTARFDMFRNPFTPIGWILKNKIRLSRKMALDLDCDYDPTIIHNSNSAIVRVEKPKQKSEIVA